MNRKRRRKKRESNWLLVLILTAIVGGIVNVIVNHFDAITAASWSIIIRVNWSDLIVVPFTKEFINAFSDIKGITLDAVNGARKPISQIIITIIVSVALLGYLPTLIRSSKSYLKSLYSKYKGEQVYQ